MANSGNIILKSLILVLAVKLTEQSGMIEFNLIQYNNTAGGYCCDFTTSAGDCQNCGLVFNLCWQKSTDTQSCSLGQVTVEKYNGYVAAVLQASNTCHEISPFPCTVTDYTGNVTLNLTIIEERSMSNGNISIVDEMQHTFEFKPSFNGKKNRFQTTIDSLSSRISMEIIMGCGRWFYGDECKTICVADRKAHLMCDDTGKLSCMSGWTDVNCTTNINDCKNHSCQNGATCKDLVNGYKCICLQEYIGQSCEILKECAVIVNSKNMTGWSVSIRLNVSRLFSMEKLVHYLKSWNNNISIHDIAENGSLREFVVSTKPSSTLDTDKLKMKIQDICNNSTAHEEEKASPTGPKPSASSPGPIIGGVTGGLVAVIGSAVAGVLLHKRFCRKFRPRVHTEKDTEKSSTGQPNTKADEGLPIGKAEYNKNNSN